MKESDRQEKDDSGEGRGGDLGRRLVVPLQRQQERPEWSQPCCVKPILLTKVCIPWDLGWCL